MKNWIPKLFLGAVTALTFFTGTYYALAAGTISFDTFAINNADCTVCAFTYTVGSTVATNGIIVLHFRTGSTPASVTSNGSNMSQKGSAISGVGINVYSYTFAATTTVNNISVTLNADDSLFYGVESFNCATTTDYYEGYASGAGGTPTLTMPGSPTTDWASVYGNRGGGATGWTGASYTQRGTAGGANAEIGDSAGTISGSTVYTWGPALFNYAVTGVEITPVVGVTCPAVDNPNATGDDDWFWEMFFGWLF